VDVDGAGGEAARRLLVEQRRTGLSWLSLWAAPQCLVPTLLLTHGAVAAGAAGMSLAIATAGLTIATSWLYGRYPRYAALVAGGAKAELTRLARGATLEAAAVCVACAGGAAVALGAIGAVSPPLAARALSPALTLALGIGNLGWLLAQALSAYLRAWRAEPLAPIIAASCAAVVLATAIAATRLTSDGTILVHAGAVLLGVGGACLLAFARLRPTA
jgi:hypothetical protein